MRGYLPLHFGFLSMVAALVLLTGCADYLNQRDSVTLAAGDAQHFNIAVQAVESRPRHAYDTDILFDGQRAARVIGAYKGTPAIPGSGSVAVNVNSAGSGPCDTPEQRARNGSRCGGRAASERPGGR